MEQILICLSVSLIAGLLMSRLARAIHLPAVTAYLVAGLLLGPFALGKLGLFKLSVKFAEKTISLNPLISNAPTMMINLIGKKAQIACELLCCCSMAYAQSNVSRRQLQWRWRF